MKELTKQCLHDILFGCTVLGTGGGGSLEEGEKVIENDLAECRTFKLISLDELGPDALVASPYFCGALSPIEEKFASEPPEPVLAFRALEEYLEEKFFAAIATELGGGNTAIALSVAAHLGIPLIDADPAGRSVPELQHTTFFLNQVPITPIGVANKYSDTVIIKEVADDFRAEAIVRSIAVASENRVGVGLITL